jgi:hypothetical protein
MTTIGRSERLPGDYRPDEGTPARGGGIPVNIIAVVWTAATETSATGAEG